MKYELLLTDNYLKLDDPYKKAYEQLGFKFERGTGWSEDRWVRQYNYKTGDDKVYIEINSLAELHALMVQVGEYLVLSPYNEIEIYNGYRE